MIVRDRWGIICQHYKDDTPIDGGDSASRTGIMALCGSAADKNVMVTFYEYNVNDGLKRLVRHPFQSKWNHEELTSRDQLVCFVAGLKGSYWWLDMLAKEFNKAYKFRINSDILAPDVKLHLNLCANIVPWWAPLGYAYLRLAILWACFVRPDDELNQILCQCIVAGKKYVRMLCKLHPNWIKNTQDYWGGWRDQEEIGEALIQKVKEYL